MFLLQMWDMRTLTLIKTYITKVPVIYVAMSPLLYHGSTNNMPNEIQNPTSHDLVFMSLLCVCCFEVVKMHQL